jgi:hypothetical protein
MVFGSCLLPDFGPYAVSRSFDFIASKFLL